jgi:hypothetical protein
MSSKPRIAILITDTYGEPFEQLRRDFSPILTAEALRNGIDCYFIKGNLPTRIEIMLEQLSNRLRYSRFWRVQRIFDALILFKFNLFPPRISVTGKEISVNVGEGLRSLGIKVLSGFFVLEENYDFVIKTTSSSVFNFKKLLEAIEYLPTSNGIPVYAGSVIRFNSNKPFVSGANLLLNRNAIQILLDNRINWNHGELDDVAIGKIMRRNSVLIHELTTLNIDSVATLEKIPLEVLKKNQHFRCKSSDFPRNDLAIMLAIVSKLDYRDTRLK